MKSEDTSGGKVTIVHLLLLWSFTTPLFVALGEGWKSGTIGIAIGLITGSIIGVGSFCGLDYGGYTLTQQIDKIRSDTVQNILFGLILLGMFISLYGSSFLAFYLVKLMTSHILHSQ